MKTVSALFDNYDDAADAVGKLEASGIQSADISIVSNRSGSSVDSASDAEEDAATGAGIGAVVGGTGGLLTGLGIMAIPGVGPVVAAGWLAATAVGALAGAVAGGVAGGIIGALTEAGIAERDAHVYAEGVRRGGTLVTARVEDHRAAQAQEILTRYRSVDLQARRSDYESAGWTSFDPEAPAYSPEEIRRVP